jgi:hypothetical protein
MSQTFPPGVYSLDDVRITYGSGPESCDVCSHVIVSGMEMTIATHRGTVGGSLPQTTTTAISDSSLVSLLRTFYQCNFFLYPDTVLTHPSPGLSLQTSSREMMGTISVVADCPPYRITLHIGSFSKTLVIFDVCGFTEVPPDLVRLFRRLQEFREQ